MVLFKKWVWNFQEFYYFFGVFDFEWLLEFWQIFQICFFQRVEVVFGNGLNIFDKNRF